VVTLEDKTPYSTYRNGLLFATAFYLLFFIINIANNIKETNASLLLILVSCWPIRPSIFPRACILLP